MIGGSAIQSLINSLRCHLIVMRQSQKRDVPPLVPFQRNKNRTR
jgi:hypothetical protein